MKIGRHLYNGRGGGEGAEPLGCTLVAPTGCTPGKFFCIGKLYFRAYLSVFMSIPDFGSMLMSKLMLIGHITKFRYTYEHMNT